MDDKKYIRYIFVKYQQIRFHIIFCLFIERCEYQVFWPKSIILHAKEYSSVLLAMRKYSI